MSTRVLSVFGTRPEAIKMVSVVRAVQAHPALDGSVLVTGQHRDMLDQVLNLFDIRPDVDLNVMKPGQDLFDLTARILLGARDALRTLRPDVVLVHGDTTTTFAVTLAAFYEGIPVGHVEAGLRTHDLAAPFPEEANRVLTDKLASLFFAPTRGSADNLLAEGHSDDVVWVTGNTVIDSLLWVRDRIATLEPSPELFGSAHPHLVDPSTPIVLITGHRRENFGGGFRRICRAISRLAVAHPNAHFVYPVHLNPNVQAPVRELLQAHANVHLLAPLAYRDFVWLMNRCRFILTDSGGIQEEAPSLGKPVLVMREVTERPEGVQAGTVRLVGTDPDRIVGDASELLSEGPLYQHMVQAHNPYGDGRASHRIADAVAAWSASRPSR